MLDLLLLPELREAIQEKDWTTLTEMASVMHPSLMGEMFAQLELEQVVTAVYQLDPQTRAYIFEYLPEEYQDDLVFRLPRAAVAKLLEHMAHDERADLFKRMDEEHREEIMPLLAQVEREDIRRLVVYDENKAGALMTTDYAALPADITAAEAINRLRQQAPDRETIYYVYVLNSERRLLGFVSLKDLILAAPRRLVGDIMKSDVLFVKAETDVETVASKLAQYDLLAIPVVDGENRLVGIITHDDVMDVVIEEATEDAHRMGAVQPLEENYLETPFLEVWRKRAVWLSLLFVAELLTFYAMANFEHAIASVVALSLFVPLCISTGGNSGAQAATLITRALALGEVGARDWWRVLRHEIAMGAALGITLGAIGFARALMTPASILGSASRWNFAMVISQSVALICLWGTLVGSMLPIVFKRLGVDPGIASSPFVATFVDVTGIVVYFSIASIWLL